jgi:hypothetical protein
LPDHAGTPHVRQIVTSRHSKPDLDLSPTVTHHKIRARAGFHDREQFGPDVTRTVHDHEESFLVLAAAGAGRLR